MARAGYLCPRHVVVDRRDLGIRPGHELYARTCLMSALGFKQAALEVV